MAYIGLATRVLLSIVFLVSLANKIRSPSNYAEFVSSLDSFRVVPPRATSVVAASVAGAEAVAMILLSIPTASRLGAGLAVALLAGLTAVVWSAVHRRVGAVCRCFSPTATPLGKRHVVRNGILLAVAAAALVEGSVDIAGALVATAAGLAGALLVLRYDDLVYLFASPALRGR